MLLISHPVSPISIEDRHDESVYIQQEKFGQPSSETIEIHVAIYTDEEEDEEFYGPYGRTRYFMWALSDYSWQVGNIRYHFKPDLVSTQDIINGKLTTDHYDVLLYPPSTADENLFMTGFSRLPTNKQRVERIVSFIENGGGYLGTCAGSAIAGSLENRPLTFFETMWKKSCMGISAMRFSIKMAVPILSQWIGRDPERIDIGGYIQYSGWNQSNYSINYHSGACLDVPLNKDNPIFNDYIEETRKIRWVSGTALIPPENPDRDMWILAQFPQEELSDNLSTRIHHWRYNGGIKGLLKAMLLGSGDIHYWEHLGIFMRAFVFAEDWDQDALLETDLATKPLMTAEIYPNQNQARIVLCSGHPEYNVWWGGHIEEVEDTDHNNIYEGFHHWNDIIPEEETLEDEFSYNYWIIRRSIAWVAKIPDNDLPPIYGASQVCDVYPYEQQPECTVTGNAELSDGIASLDLYYRYSTDNRTWDTWTLYETDTTEEDGWSWVFSMPHGAGYYQFYSLKHIRYEYGWFNETPPPGPDAVAYVEGWRQINEDGFGSMFNRGVRGMEIFDDCLLIGTANYNNFSGLVCNRSYTALSLFYELVVNGSRPADNFKGDGCEIWRYNGTYMSQLIGENSDASLPSGFDNPDNLEVGVLISYKNHLYAGLRNQVEGGQIWRTQDLRTWEKVVDGGFGNPHNVAPWSAAIFNDVLYIGTINFKEGCEIFKTNDGKTWKEVLGEHSSTSSGFGTKHNFYAWSMCVYDSTLYVGTDNLKGGGELWKSRDGTSWEPVIAYPTWIQAKANGADFPRGFSKGLINYRGGVRTMAVYHDELYIGLAAEDISIQVMLPRLGTIGRIYQQLPFLIHPLKRLLTMGCEIWKFNSQTDTWTRVVGGLLKGNASGGFGDWRNEYPWSMIVSNDCLYVGTLHSDPVDISLKRYRLIRPSITMVTPSGKGEIWCYDGTRWENINNGGFGDSYNIGIRGLKDYKGTLIAGTMNVATGCELWEYAVSRVTS